MRTLLTPLVALMALGLAVSSLQANPPSNPPSNPSSNPPSGQTSNTLAPIFRDADMALGERLIKEHRCSECHAKKFGGDGSAVYRPKGRISTAGLLRGMVEQCNTELNLGLFPEEVTAVAAVLNREHYRLRN